MIAFLAVAWAAEPLVGPPLEAAPVEDTGISATVPFVWTPAAPPRSELAELFPSPTPRTGVRAALALATVAVGLGAVAGATRSVRGSLRDSGALPAMAGVVEALARIGVGLAGAGALLALVPESLLPAVPFAAIAVALAVGWSARDALPDLVAFGFLAAEGRLVPGAWVRGDGFAGRIERIGPRATWITDASGERVAVPNRKLLADPVSVDAGAYPVATVELHLPELPPATARAALVEAALLSAWVAPGAAPEVGCDPAAPDRWTVRMRLVDGRYEDRFRGTFPERVRESLAALSRGC